MAHRLMDPVIISANMYKTNNLLPGKYFYIAPIPVCLFPQILYDSEVGELGVNLKDKVWKGEDLKWLGQYINI